MTELELDETSFPAWQSAIEQFDLDAVDHVPRTYPGYPRIPLPRPRRRLRSSLERSLARRASPRTLGTNTPSAAVLGRILHLAHGIRRDGSRGPVPSAGGLQALELYLVAFTDTWLPAGAHHYDRAAHALSGIALGRDAVARIRSHIPSLITVGGGALLWLIVGDRARVTPKYGARGLKFLWLEAGHLMQNLCLASVDTGLATVPLGGYYERPLARALQLPATDEVLYVGLCG